MKKQFLAIEIILIIGLLKNTSIKIYLFSGSVKKSNFLDAQGLTGIARNKYTGMQFINSSHIDYVCASVFTFNLLDVYEETHDPIDIFNEFDNMLQKQSNFKYLDEALLQQDNKTYIEKNNFIVLKEAIINSVDSYQIYSIKQSECKDKDFCTYHIFHGIPTRDLDCYFGLCSDDHLLVWLYLKSFDVKFLVYTAPFNCKKQNNVQYFQNKVKDNVNKSSNFSYNNNKFLQVRSLRKNINKFHKDETKSNNNKFLNFKKINRKLVVNPQITFFNVQKNQKANKETSLYKTPSATLSDMG